MRVLVVEDDIRMASMLQRGLLEEGFSVDLAQDGPAAVQQATMTDYDVIVLDLMLPTFDGFEVCRRLRQGRRWAPVLMLTARDSVGDRIRGLDSGADDYLTKPFSFGELSARMRALLRRGVGERPVVLRAGDLSLDPATHIARRATVELALSAKEFALLELFLRHVDQVLPRTRILDHVWDLSYSGLSNVVDQYVGYLRRKIDRPFGLEQLETVRGTGYRLRREARVITAAGRDPGAGRSAPRG